MSIHIEPLTPLVENLNKGIKENGDWYLDPTLVVNDLKLGADNKGSIGLWIGPGTEAHFSNLQITKMDQ